MKSSREPAEPKGFHHSFTMFYDVLRCFMLHVAHVAHVAHVHHVAHVAHVHHVAHVIM